MISTEEHNDQPKIAVVTREGTRTGANATEKGKGVEQCIRKAVEPMPTFNPQKENETYQHANKVILGLKWIASTSKAPSVYDMPLVYDHTIQERSVEKVNTLKYFIKSCLELMQDETMSNTLCGMIDQCTQDREVPMT
jgi:hypothetical protein